MSIDQDWPVSNVVGLLSGAGALGSAANRTVGCPLVTVGYCLLEYLP